MTNERINELFADTSALLYNNKDFNYLANLQYKTLHQDIANVDKYQYCGSLIRASGTYVPDTFTAADYAHYIISVLMGVAAVDLFLDYLVQHDIKFNIKSTSGHVDFISYTNITPAKFHQTESCIEGALNAFANNTLPVVRFTITFMVDTNLPTYDCLDLPVYINFASQTTNMNKVITCKVRELNVKLFQTAIDSLRW